MQDIPNLSRDHRRIDSQSPKEEREDNAPISERANGRRMVRLARSEPSTIQQPTPFPPNNACPSVRPLCERVATDRLPAFHTFSTSRVGIWHAKVRELFGRDGLEDFRESTLFPATIQNDAV